MAIIVNMIVWIVTRKVRIGTMTVRIFESIVRIDTWTVRLGTKIGTRSIRISFTLMGRKETGLARVVMVIIISVVGFKNGNDST